MQRKKKTPADIIEEERREKSKAELNSILNKKVVDRQYDKVQEKLHARERKTFKGEGAFGKVPGWFQEQKYHFVRLSNSMAWLENLYSLKKVRKMMAEYRKHKIDNNPASLDTAEYGHMSVVCFYYDDVFAAGKEEGLKKMHGKETAKQISAGSKVIKGGHNANIKTYGTKEDREREHEEWKKEAVNLHEQHHKWPWYKIAESVGKKFGKSERTIREHVKNVRK